MFFLEVLVNLTILVIEEAFKVKQNPLSQIQYTSSNKEEEEDNRYIPLLLLGRMALKEEEEGIDICSLPSRLVATINSFNVRN
jgi:hypothetical protein